MAARRVQTALVQAAADHKSEDEGSLLITLSHDVRVPVLCSPHDVLVRVSAVALNPIDHKMLTHFPAPGNLVGCDFCGVVVEKGALALHDVGTRVCGAVFPYSRQQQQASGAFAEFLAADCRLLLRLPDAWEDTAGAALGQVGWGTAALALSDPDALGLTGLPTAPSAASEPVLIYGAATATGAMACQLLALSGYKPIAVTSEHSASLAVEFGAAGTAAYTSPNCVETVRALAREPLRHALDCITSADSAAACFAAIARTGGRYACLEGLPDAWRTRRAVRVREVMGYEGHGRRVEIGSVDSTYSRAANPALFELCCRWTGEMQGLLTAGKVKHHPFREVEGGWRGIVDGLAALQRGEVRAQKLVVRISDS